MGKCPGGNYVPDLIHPLTPPRSLGGFERRSDAADAAIIAGEDPDDGDDDGGPPDERVTRAGLAEEPRR